jgi:hypothetical protein
LIQNRSDVPKKRASRSAVSALIRRWPCAISLTRQAGTPISLASWYWLIPSGLRNSSSRIFPPDARALLAEPGVRGRLPVVIPGTDAVACASDNGGEDGLDVIPAEGSAARRIGHGEFGRTVELAVAPDGRTAAVACADGRLLTVALAGEPVITQIARNANEAVSGLAFAPDSALLAWSQPWRTERGHGRGQGEARRLQEHLDLEEDPVPVTPVSHLGSVAHGSERARRSPA